MRIFALNTSWNTFSSWVSSKKAFHRLDWASAVFLEISQPDSIRKLGWGASNRLRGAFLCGSLINTAFYIYWHSFEHDTWTDYQLNDLARENSARFGC